MALHRNQSISDVTIHEPLVYLSDELTEQLKKSCTITSFVQNRISELAGKRQSLQHVKPHAAAEMRMSKNPLAWHFCNRADSMIVGALPNRYL